MAYADYEYYTTTYLGTAIQEADFPRLSLRASSFLDYYTQSRAVQNKNLDALKMACCAVAEQYQTINASLSAEGGELQSQTVGSWSKSYRSGGESAAQATASASAAQASLAAAANQYLAGTGLLYRGREYGYGHVSSCCDGL